eukprot:1148400-Prymnesium_polylepis.1
MWRPPPKRHVCGWRPPPKRHVCGAERPLPGLLTGGITSADWSRAREQRRERKRQRRARGALHIGITPLES